MFSFKQFLMEDENLDSIKPGTIPVSVIFGRFQPWHNGHQQIVKDLLKKYPQYKIIIGIVKGEKTSLDKSKNPFPFELQKKLIEESSSDLSDKVSVFPEPLTMGYVPYIIEKFREKDLEVKIISAGADRAVKFQEDIKKLNEKFITVNVEFYLAKRYLTGTEVRLAIKNNDIEKLKTMINPKILKYMNELKKYV